MMVKNIKTWPIGLGCSVTFEVAYSNGKCNNKVGFLFYIYLK